jgi:peptidoglycan/LPS O-acetylase OafA/YrhL
MTLGDAIASGRSRNLDLLRHLLAIAVIFSHAWPLALGPGTPEPLETLTGRSLGGWAVGVFFFISGMLITASAECKLPLPFWAARVRRLVPGLFVALLVTFALSVASGSSTGIVEAAAWFARAITLISIEHRLTGAFAENPYPEVVNGPLWSLFHEVVAYAICGTLVWMGVTRSTKAVLVLALLATGISLFHATLPGRASVFAPLFSAFTLGIAAQVLRDRIAIRPITAALCLSMIFLVPWPIASGFVGLGLAISFLCMPSINLPGDASYGLYIYGWPLAQAIVAIWPEIDPVRLGVLSVLATYPLAVASWHLVERPALFATRARV